MVAMLGRCVYPRVLSGVLLEAREVASRLPAGAASSQEKKYIGSLNYFLFGVAKQPLT